ncbi:M42 family metallopeptidase [Candidatus Bipolaricaulota bacterium]|jgi:endoglucanase|nr:M42 family metallopeptidase [Candidatus Bipolaricaulota bacterium]
MELLKRLSEAAGIPGYEAAVRAIVAEALEGHVDSMEVDALGNLISHKKGDGPVVVIACHMDEIGFLVRHIDEKTGFLRIEPLGGFDPITLVAQRVMVHTDDGDFIGCIGRKATHILTPEERKKPLELKDLAVDLGLPADTVKEKVAIGDTVTLRQDFIEYGDVVSGKALDDRLGIYIGIEALKRAVKPTCDIYLVGTTQEEVGLRGARVAGQALNPDIGIALDVTIAADTPGVPPQHQVTQLGKGVAIKLKDSASISHPGMVKAMKKLAEEKGIPYQMEILPRGGTDAGGLQLANDGAAVITLSIPTRYVHSVIETAHKDDIEATINLLAAFLEKAGQIDLTG